MAGQSSSPPRKNVADRLALVVVSLAAIILVLLVVLAVYSAPNEQRTDTAKDVLNAVLPLIASWVGTVLAYYYSRENLSAATRSATELARNMTGAEKLRSLAARETLMPYDRIDAMAVAAHPFAVPRKNHSAAIPGGVIMVPNIPATSIHLAIDSPLFFIVLSINSL